MKGDNPYLMRALYIILVPLVLLMILLNSGWLQRLLPAAEVHGEHYSVVRYNFYYFDCYRTFLAENEGRFAELGFDPQRSEGQQTRPDGQTWKEYFQILAEAELAETAYYCDLAQAAGYQFSEAELAPVAQRLAAQREEYTLFGVAAGRYYVSYYGAGMTREAYEAELTRKVQAQAYQAFLTGAVQPEQADIDRWIREECPGQADYRTASLRIITLEALPDRETGETGPAQLEALAAKLARLEERYENGASFSELQAAFSTCALGGPDGTLSGAAAGDLPAVLADWCLTGQDALAPGQVFSAIDRETGTAYFAVLDELGGSGLEQAARAALSAQTVAARQAEGAGGYTVERSGIGMLLATT